MKPQNQIESEFVKRMNFDQYIRFSEWVINQIELKI